MSKKYEFTGETMKFTSLTLNRIRALRDIPEYEVSAGDLGGFIEREDNLSHNGNSWVGDNAMVFSNAVVFDNAWVYGDARVYGDAHVFDNASIYARATVFGYARIFNDAIVSDGARVWGKAWVCGDAIVSDGARVWGSAVICGNAFVQNACVSDSACISGNAQIECNANITRGEITKTEQVLVIGPIGSMSKCATFYKPDKDIYVSHGYFNGTLDEFKSEVKKTRPRDIYGVQYDVIINLIENYPLWKGEK